MADTPSITIVKSFPYRGQPEEWSNKYHFSGTVPSTPTAWKALSEAIWNEERKFLPAQVTLVASYGYNAGTASSVNQINFTEDLPANPAGLASPTTIPPGDVAAWVRWKTADRNSKGRPIYLRKYFHAVGVTGTETIQTSIRTAMVAYAGKMTDGTLPGGFKVCGPQGGLAGVAKVPTFVTTRTLKRRGADPS